QQPNIAHATTFTGKELDASGYYYFGARYYDPQVQIWLSPDPILASYMQGGPNGGIFTSRNLGLYSYAWNNPVRVRDPNGLTNDGAHGHDGHDPFVPNVDNVEPGRAVAETKNGDYLGPPGGYWSDWQTQGQRGLGIIGPNGEKAKDNSTGWLLMPW